MAHGNGKGWSRALLSLARFFYFPYSTRRLLRAAARWINKFRLHDWTVVELGCGQGHLAARIHQSRYIGIDQPGQSLASARKRCSGARFRFLEGDVETVELPGADLMVLLQLADRMEKENFARLLSRIPSKRILFSFTEAGKKNRWFKTKATTYRAEELTALLEKSGYRHCEIRKLPLFQPARLVFAARTGHSVLNRPT